MTTISQQEDKLILAARLLDKSQLGIVVDVVDFLISKKTKKPPTEEDKQEFLRVLDNMRNKAVERGLTPEILEQILAEDE